MTISATKFKAQCLGLMERVNRTRRPLAITKRGKVVARLVPADDPEFTPGGLDAAYGFARKFRRTRRTADWMRELRAGEQR